MNKEVVIKRCETSEYKAWQNMRNRCNWKGGVYKYYGAKGIRVCKRWDSFENFLEDMGKKPDLSFELDRINVYKNYTPKNCRWIDKKTQQRNQRRTIFLTLKGKKMKLVEWAEYLNVNVHTLRTRIKRGHPIEKVLSNLNYKRKDGKTLSFT